MKIKSQQGSGLIEYLVGLTLLTALTGGILQISRLTLAHLWLNHILYQALICQAENQIDCKKEALQKVNLIPVGTTETHIRLFSSGPTKGYGEIKWRGFGQLELTLLQHLNLNAKKE